MTLGKGLLAVLISIAVVGIAETLPRGKQFRMWLRNWLDRIDRERRQEQAAAIEWPIGEVLEVPSPKITRRARREAQRNGKAFDAARVDRC